MGTLRLMGSRTAGIAVCVLATLTAAPLAVAQGGAPAAPQAQTPASAPAAAPWPAPSPAQPPSAPPVPAPAAGVALYDIACAYVKQEPTFASVRAAWLAITGKGKATTSEPTDTTCDRGKEPNILVGPGVVVIVVDEGDYNKATAAAKANKAVEQKLPRLFLNGYDLGPKSTLESEARSDGKVALSFPVGTRSEGTEKFWSSAYGTNGLLGRVPLRVAMGWQERPEFDGKLADGPKTYVQVTSWPSLIAATVLMIVLVLSFVWALLNSDVFRVRPLDVFWHDAYALRKCVFREVFGARPGRAVSLDFSRDADRIKSAFEAQGVVFVWPTQDVDVFFADCRTGAAEQLKQGLPPTDAAGRQRVFIGLGIAQTKWNLPRLPYSLGKTQPGVWLTFAVTAAVYLWLVWGEFPALAGSVLGLLAVSAATGGASQLVDNQIVPSSAPSQGFLFDLLTDNADVQQAHRYQSLVVNGLLLVVGVVYVVQYLLYPTFDPTWVALLALSGASQVVLKQTVEVSKPNKPGQQPAQQRANQAAQAAQPAQPGQPVQPAQAAQAARPAGQ